MNHRITKHGIEVFSDRAGVLLTYRLDYESMVQVGFKSLAEARHLLADLDNLLPVDLIEYSLTQNLVNMSNNKKEKPLDKTPRMDADTDSNVSGKRVTKQIKRVLNKSIRKHGFDYQQVKRNDHVALYQQSKYTYEVFLIKIGSPKELPSGKVLPLRELFPHDEAFGKWAWSIHGLEMAEAFFEYATRQKESGDRINFDQWKINYLANQKGEKKVFTKDDVFNAYQAGKDGLELKDAI